MQAAEHLASITTSRLITIDPRSPVLKSGFDTPKLAKKSLLDLYPGLIAPSGQLSLDVVVHESSSRPLFQLVRDQIREFVPGGISDEWYKSKSRSSEVIAERPVLAGRKDDIDFYLSQRNSPPLFGLGLIDSIDQANLIKIAQLQYRRSKGKISGRLGPGKFGWRAQTATLDAFVRGACAGEVGLQLAATPQPGDVADETYVSLGIDLTEPQVRQLVSYVRSLPRPIPETKLPEESMEIGEGKRLFGRIGCAACHVEKVHSIRGLYSDLLLHDMGSLLQAPSPAPTAFRGRLNKVIPMRVPFFRPEIRPLASGSSISGYYGTTSSLPTPYAFERPAEPKFPYGKLPPKELDPNTASLVTWDVMQREWRTPPLWGVADSGPYLHDGRAETLDAAIRWHGGEAHESATNYRTLPKESREQLIGFLRSLRSPPSFQRTEQEQLAGKSKLGGSVGNLGYTKSEKVDKGSLKEALKVFQDAF